MLTPDLCTEEEVRTLVHAFYAKVRKDDVLGPIFNTQVHDWDEHLLTLTSFWSSILRATGSYTGTPMQKHAAMPHLDEALFQRWLSLFLETTKEQPNEAMGQRAYTTAQRIAQSLWYSWQMKNEPGSMPKDLRLD
ncbi:group III truncated hemoglobin [Oxalicibacterium faecigallinarum]|uniref:Preprotein translocase subunit TatC n=1 Tax=Oxalicibacterium faecigallinarum TaxID=573741 RepID=A0A8J3F1J9_9BURK|nr:group III truncated hemoglobin [Oxalicibacterium faecigallinarum]GGI16681.1 preprotein translocase subunit TatC [Oxalicibacterium faecigallinarum]